MSDYEIGEDPDKWLVFKEFRPGKLSWFVSPPANIPGDPSSHPYRKSFSTYRKAIDYVALQIRFANIDKTRATLIANEVQKGAEARKAKVASYTERYGA